MTEWRDTADDEAGLLVCLVGGRTTQIRQRDDSGEACHVDAVGAADERDHSDPLRVAWSHEDEALHDLADLGADGARSIGRGVSRLGKDGDLEVDTFAVSG